MTVKFIDDDINARLQPTTLDKGKKKCDLNIKQQNSESTPVISNLEDNSHNTSQNLESGMNSSQTPCMKAKFLRKQRKQNKLMAQGKSQEEIEAIFKESKQENQVKSLEELFDEVYNENNRLQVGCTFTSLYTSPLYK